MKKVLLCVILFCSLMIQCKSPEVGMDKARIPEPAIPFDPRDYVCCRPSAPLRMDGILDEACWRKAEWTEDFMDIEGDLKPKPRFRTRVKMLWDDDFFYIAAELEEPNVWATLKERDSVIFYDNDFEVFIDPDGDTHAYYELEINALGTLWDLFLVMPYRDGGPAVHHWDIRGIRSGVHVTGTLNRFDNTDTGWSVEIALPWEVLRECAPGKKRPSAGDVWRVNFSRVEWRTKGEGNTCVKVTGEDGKLLPEDNWVWSPQGLINMHYPEMWGMVQFSDLGAGEKSGPFRMADEEAVKWQLRRVYYAEWRYCEQNGIFSGSLEKLGVKRPAKGIPWPPAIEATDHLFEARMVSERGLSWVISNDGKVRRTE